MTSAREAELLAAQMTGLKAGHLRLALDAPQHKRCFDQRIVGVLIRQGLVHEITATEGQLTPLGVRVATLLKSRHDVVKTDVERAPAVAEALPWGVARALTAWPSRSTPYLKQLDHSTVGSMLLHGLAELEGEEEGRLVKLTPLGKAVGAYLRKQRKERRAKAKLYLPGSGDAVDGEGALQARRRPRCSWPCRRPRQQGRGVLLRLRRTDHRRRRF